MRCKIDSGSTCRRCQRLGLPCIFVPRANAPALLVPASLPLSAYQPPDVINDVLQRVKTIEDHLGLNSSPSQSNLGIEANIDEPMEPWHDDEPLDKLWEVSAIIERCAVGHRDAPLWKRSIIRHLWKTCEHSSTCYSYRTMCILTNVTSQIPQQDARATFFSESAKVLIPWSCAFGRHALLLERPRRSGLRLSCRWLLQRSMLCNRTAQHPGERGQFAAHTVS